MTPNRLVALATPLAAPLAGWLAAWIATHFPGLNIPQNAIEEIFIAGSLFAVAPAAQWLHGWQKWEAQQARTEEAVQLATIGAGAEPTIEMNFEEESFEDFGEFEDFDEFEDLEEFDDELFADEEPAPVGV
jgi:hypothetical protein